MSNSTEHSTIPRWPSACTRLNGVYRNCKSLSNAWTTSAEELMPERITTEHSEVVLGAGEGLAKLFDVSWGGTSNLFSYISFKDENGNYFSDTTPPLPVWKNHQRVKTGTDAIPPDINDKASTYPESRWNSSWDGRWQNVNADANVQLRFNKREYNVEFYDLYNGIELLSKNTIWRLDSITPPSSSYLKEKHGGHAIEVAWTESSGNTEETSGTPIPASDFETVTRNITAYWHYVIDERVTANFHYLSGYFRDSPPTADYETLSQMVDYDRSPIPPQDHDVDKRVGWTLAGWYKDNDVSQKITDFSTEKIHFDSEYFAKYNRNLYTVSFFGGYDGLPVSSCAAFFEGNIPIENLPSYGNEYPHIQYYGWGGDSSQWTSVSSNANVSSLFVSAAIDTDVVHFPSYLTSTAINGHVSEGNVTNVTISVAEGKSAFYGIENQSYTGNEFSFDLTKTEYAPSYSTETITANITSYLGNIRMTYKVPLTAYVNYNSITLYFNDTNFGRNRIREKDGVNVDATWMQPSPYMQNPDLSKYMGAFESISGWHVNDGWARMRIGFTGYDRFRFYIKNCGQRLKDFPYVSKINNSFATKPTTASESVYRYFSSSSPSSDTSILTYNEVYYEGLDFEETYFVDVAYVKNSVYDDSTDRSYILLDCREEEMIPTEQKHVMFDNTPLTD